MSYMVNVLQTARNYFKWILILGLLPCILSFLLYLQINDISKSKDDFNISTGKIDIVGFTEKVHKGNAYKRLPIKSKTKVLFVKLKGNGNLYSFLSKDEKQYDKIFSILNEDDLVRIYHSPPVKTQNTIDIIQLEKDDNVLIDKSIFDEKRYVQIKITLIILAVYFGFPLLFFILSVIEQRKIHGKQ